MTGFSLYLTRKTPHQVHVFNTGEECLVHLSVSPEVIVLDYYPNTIQKNAANCMEILQVIKDEEAFAKVNARSGN